jgi:transcriptional regulator with XRE-family HTH domain
MKLKDYLKEKNINISLFAQMIGLNRATLSRYIKGIKTIPLYVKMAIAYVTFNQVHPNDWD